MPTKIVVIGMGYVGIPMAVLLADVDDFYVTGVQRRSQRSGWKIDWLNQGKNPYEGDEPGLDKLIEKVVKNEKFRVTNKYDAVKDADYVLIDVQTPVDDEKIPRYASLLDVSERIAKHMKKGVTIILESTVAPGTTGNVVQSILEKKSGLKRGEDFYLVFSPERVMPGKLLEYITDFPRVIGGGCQEANEKAKFLYGKVVKKELQVTDTLTAELTKCIENAYRDVNIAFANEMALLSEDFDRNIFEIINLINHRHDRMMHYPGSGVGGHCLTKDPWLLLYGFNKYTEKLNESKIKIIPDSRKINDYMPYHMIKLMEHVFRDSHRLVDNIKIVLLGVSYKANTDDTRNTPTENIIKVLKSRYHSHNIEYIAHDPYVNERDYKLTKLTSDFNEAVTNADVLMFTTNHSEYYNIDLDDLKEIVNTPIIIDGRNIFDKKTVENKGFIYRKVGEGSKKPV
ncbi:MAG: nucleotide sugar dehydrogenase [Candidatus Lokiarchaeota archaeon]|nr:nucleotide sugar dehydrogenase [Candidatus Lokiarchaeota archaeon]